MTRNKNPIPADASRPASEIAREISAKLDGLTPRQRVLAEYLMSNPEDLAFCSVARLAERAQVSQATVVRFCHALGYEGFTHLAQQAQERLQGYLGTVGRFQLARQDLDQADSGAAQGAFERVVNNEMQNLAGLSQAVNRHEFYSCVERIIKADQICIVGCLTSMALADFFGYILQKLIPQVKVVHNQGTRLASALGQFTQKSMAFLIAFPRYPQEVVRIGELMAPSPAQVVAITNSHASPVVPLADHSFVMPVSISSYADAYAAPMTFISALVSEVSESMPRRTQRALSKYEDYVARAGIFAPPLTGTRAGKK